MDDHLVHLLHHHSIIGVDAAVIVLGVGWSGRRSQRFHWLFLLLLFLLLLFLLLQGLRNAVSISRRDGRSGSRPGQIDNKLKRLARIATTSLFHRLVLKIYFLEFFQVMKKAYLASFLGRILFDGAFAPSALAVDLLGNDGVPLLAPEIDLGLLLRPI